MKCIGIDIGSYSVKIAEIDASTKGLQLLTYNEFTLSHEPGSDNQVAILDVIRNVAQMHDPQSTKYIFCVPQSQASSRFRVFPFKDRYKIQKSLAFELEDDIPFDQDDAIFDAKFVRFTNSATDVLASAVPKSYVQEVLQIARDCGIDPDIVSIEGIALANMVEDFSQPPPTVDVPDAIEDDIEENSFDSSDDGESPALKQPQSQGHVLLDIGFKKTIVTIFREFTLVSARTIEWGGHDIAQAISGKYNIPYTEAIKELESKAFILTNKEGASRDQITFSDTISGSLREMIRSLKLILLDNRSEFNLHLSHIALTGGVSQIRNLGPFLTQSTEIPANSFDHFQRFPENYIEKNPHIVATSALALSLAIEGAKRPLNPPANLRKGDFGKQSETLKLFWNKWGYTVRVAAIALVALFIYGILKSMFAEDVNSTAKSALRKHAKRAGIKGRKATPTNIKRYIRQKDIELKNRETLAELSKMNSALDLLENVSQSFPGKKKVGVDIQQFSVDVDKLKISGIATNKTELPLIEDALKRVARNGKLKKLPPIRPAAPPRTAFSYEIFVERKIPSPKKSRGKKL